MLFIIFSVALFFFFVALFIPYASSASLLSLYLLLSSSSLTYSYLLFPSSLSSFSCSLMLSFLSYCIIIRLLLHHCGILCLLFHHCRRLLLHHYKLPSHIHRLDLHHIHHCTFLYIFIFVILIIPIITTLVYIFIIVLRLAFLIDYVFMSLSAFFIFVSLSSFLIIIIPIFISFLCSVVSELCLPPSYLLLSLHRLLPRLSFPFALSLLWTKNSRVSSFRLFAVFISIFSDVVARWGREHEAS